MTKKSFPKEIFVICENEGTEEEFLLIEKNIEAVSATSQGQPRLTATYQLVGVGVVETTVSIRMKAK